MIIPDSRRMNWEPGVTVGVPGGIAQYASRTMFVNVLTTSDTRYKCIADGTTACSGKIQAALLDCPAGQYVYVPAGTYLLGGTMAVNNGKKNVTLRGAGMGQTIFTCLNGFGRFQISATSAKAAALTVTAGATQGSTVLTVADASTVQINKLITLRMDTPVWMHRTQNALLENQDAQSQFEMTFKVTAKTASTVTITPPLPMTVTPWNPRIIPWTSPLTEGFGYEDFTLDAQLGDASPFEFNNSWGCWFKGVEIAKTKGRQIFMNAFCMGEIRKCYTHDTQNIGNPNHEGFCFRAVSCWNLIEDNICINGGKSAIVLGDGAGRCCGNVVGYNYVTHTDLPAGSVSFPDFATHSCGNILNLWEGNVGGQFASDGYFGSESYITLLRNAFHNKTNNIGPMAVTLQHYCDFFNLVGNVLGHPEKVGSKYDTEVQGPQTTIYRLGYPNIGNWGYGGASVPAGTTVLSVQSATQLTMSNNAYTGGIKYVRIDGVLYKNTTLTAGSPIVTCPTASWDASFIGKTIVKASEGAPDSSYGGNDTILPTTPPNYSASWNYLPMAQALDLNVKNTIIRHGNYDYATKNADGSSRTPNIVWETDDARGTGVGFADHTIPESYYLLSKTATGVVWGNLTYPPIDPASPATSIAAGAIPAHYRYLNGMADPPIGVETKIISVVIDVPDFGDRAIGATAATGTLTISSLGTGAIAASGITYPTGYSGNNWSGSIAAGGNHTETVTFTPVAAVTYAGDIVVASNKESGMNTAAVTGNGVAVAVDVPVPFFLKVE